MADPRRPRFANEYQPGVAMCQLLYFLAPPTDGEPIVLYMVMQTTAGEPYMTARLTETGAERITSLLEAEEDRLRDQQRTAPTTRHLRLINHSGTGGSL
ncbi:hypothetical protein [Streptomyces sp. NPDC002172]